MITKLTLEQSERVEKDYRVTGVEFNDRNGYMYVNHIINGKKKWTCVELTWWDNLLGRTLDDKVNIVLNKVTAFVEKEKQAQIQYLINKNEANVNRKVRNEKLKEYEKQKNDELKQRERELFIPIGGSAHGKPADKGAELFKNRPLHENIDELSSAIRSGKVTVNKRQMPTSPRPEPPAPQPKHQQDSSFRVATPKKSNYYRNDDIYEDNDRSGGLFTRDNYAPEPCRDSGSSRGGYEPSPSSDGGSCGGGGSDD